MNPIRDYMSEVIINVTKRTPWDSIGKELISKKLPEIIINVTIKSLAEKLEGDFVRSDRDNFST